LATPTLNGAERITGELIDIYLPLTQAADRRINPRRWLLADYSTAAHSEFSSYEDALAWMDSAAPVIRGCIRIANATSRHEAAWKFAEALHGWLHIRKDFRLWRLTHEIAEESSRECCSASHARILASLGECHLWLEENGIAEAYLQRALAQWRTAEHSLGQASTLEGLGTVELKKGNPEQARDHVMTARGMFAQEGRERGVVLMTRRVGETYLAEGRFHESLKHLDMAYRWFRSDGDSYQQVRTGRSRIRALARAGKTVEAHTLLRDIIGVAEEIGADNDAHELARMAEQTTAGL